jgi:glycosyltransferase involved in cell wall biosynthesis
MGAEKMIKVAVCITTYNQEKYIGEAIESALIQRTDFEVDIIIGEDHSSDSTLSICKEYERKNPSRIILFANQSNMGVAANTMNLFQYVLLNNYKYTAILDGDDFWNDQLKLQKQVDYLENNKEYGFIHTSNGSLNDKTGKLNLRIRRNVPTGNIFNLILREPLIINCTVMFCTKYLEYFDFETIRELRSLLAIDHLTNVIISSYTELAFLEDVTAVWRQHNNNTSISHSLVRQYAWIEHEITQAIYINSLYPELYKFSLVDATRYRAFRQLESAFNCRVYNEAKRINKEYDVVKDSPLAFWTKNRLFFNCYYFRKFIISGFRRLKSFT